jgi:hypothetical protein
MNEFLKPKIKELALKHKLTQSQVIDIFYSQFKHAAKIMSEDSYKDPNERRSIKFKGLGTFEYNKYKAIIVTKIKQEKDARENMAESLTEN